MMSGSSSSDKPTCRRLYTSASPGRRAVRVRFDTTSDARLIDECTKLAVQLSEYASAWTPSETLAPGPELDALDSQLSTMHSHCRESLQFISSCQAMTASGRKAKAEVLVAYLDMMSSLDLPELNAARSLAVDLLD